MLTVAVPAVLTQPISLKMQNVICGADQTDIYFERLKSAKVGLVANKSSMIGDVHLLDKMLNEGVHVVSIFCPEHGFRGEGEAGERIDDHLDPVTGIPVISIYGSKKKPDPDDLSGIDILVFDMQDVGARFYTYISTLHYVMEAAGELEIPLIILDRPNPNGFYVDGPIREPEFTSFVGMHPIPVVHGMTIGEYGLMINGEGWLSKSVQCEVSVVPCLNYDHLTAYELPVRPSPNLPNQISVYLYPSLCFFEGTKVSIGRGTKLPFQILGHPDLDQDFTFRPVSTPGASLNPKCKDQLCFGWDVRRTGIKMLFDKPGIQLEWVIKAYNELGQPSDFFRAYFDTLSGTKRIREMIESGYDAETIRKSWDEELRQFMLVREKYLIYPDF